MALSTCTSLLHTSCFSMYFSNGCEHFWGKVEDTFGVYHCLYIYKVDNYFCMYLCKLEMYETLGTV